jgi:hypothetical protein
MGGKLSKNPDDVQILARDRNGQIIIYTANSQTPEQMEECTRLPISMEQNVRYLFLSTLDKKWHAHVYADEICDTVGNDVVHESPLLNKNVNHIKYSANTNSNYFHFNKDPVNTPDYPILADKNDKQRYTSKKAFTQCTPMPFYATETDGISLDYNGVPMVLYTDDKCQNEYVINLPLNPRNPQYDYTRRYNENNRSIDHKKVSMPFTNVKTYIKPSPSTNARFYRTFRDDYRS